MPQEKKDGILPVERYNMELTQKVTNTENFTYQEFINSNIADNYNISNLPPETDADLIWSNIEHLTQNVLQPIRDEFGKIRILSGYRSPKLNTKINGSLNSHHLFGRAADIEPIDKSVKLFDILKFIHNELIYTELIAEYFPNGWIHVALRKYYAPTKVIKLKDKRINYKKVDLDYIAKRYSI